MMLMAKSDNIDTFHYIGAENVWHTQMWNN
jgi:hypothetical protein